MRVVSRARSKSESACRGFVPRHDLVGAARRATLQPFHLNLQTCRQCGIMGPPSHPIPPSVENRTVKSLPLVRFALAAGGIAVAAIGLPVRPARGADDDIRQLKLRDWEPRSMLVTKSTIVETPRFPVIDIHNHLGGGKGWLTPQRVERYLSEMDAAGVRTVINLDGGWDDQLKEIGRASCRERCRSRWSPYH